MRIWKWVGLAGVVGVAAVGVAKGTAVRRRREFVDATPDELQVRLHARYAEAQARQSTASTL